MKTIDQLMERLDEASAKGETSITVTVSIVDQLVRQLEAALKSTPEA